MTVPATPRRAGPYDGNGVTTAFGFSFKAFDEADVRVVELDEPTSVESDATLNSDYTVALNPDQESTPGGTVNYLVAPTSDKKVTLIGNLNYEQPVDLPDGGGYRAQQVEDGFDRLAIQMQQIKEIIDRCAQVPVSSTDASDLFESINTLAANIAVLQTVVDNITDLVVLADDIADVNALAAIVAQINAVAAIAADVVAVAAIDAEIVAVEAIAADIQTVAANIAAILTAVANLPALAGKANSGANSDITSLAGLTTPLSVAQGGTGSAYGPTAKIQPFTVTVNGVGGAPANGMRITLNPTTLDFRSSTLGSGTVNTRQVATAITMTVSSGSTLGTTNAVLSRLAVLAIDNAGTVELAVVNLLGGVDIGETGVISTTAEGGAGGADSASTIYSTTARTNVPYRIVGFIESTQATAGTWATAPSLVNVSGDPLAMWVAGYGRTMQNVGGSRALSTDYTNNTGRTIIAYITQAAGGPSAASALLDGNAVLSTNVLTNLNAIFTLEIRPGGTYRANGSTSVTSWWELR